MKKNNIQNLFRGGLFHIFGSSMIAQVGGLISSALVIRYLPKDAYGSYVQANNLYSYFSIFIGIGMTTAVLQFCCEQVSIEKKNAIYRYTLSKGSIFNVFLACIIGMFGQLQIYFGDVDVGYYLKMMCALPFVVYLNSYFQIVLRVKKRNQQYSYVNIVYTISCVISNIVFVKIWGILGLVFAIYVANSIASIFSIIFLYRSCFFQELKLSQIIILERKQKVEIIKYAIVCSITNFTSSLLVLLDVTCLGFVLESSEVLADYKVASTIPSACIFIPNSLMVYFYPHMIEKKSIGIENFEVYLKKILKIFLIINFIVFIALVFFAPFIINLIYGEKYLNTVSIFRILCVNYFFTASFRKVLGNAIVVLKKVTVNLLYTVIAGVLNIVLNLVLITNFYSKGAAYATVIVTIFVSCLSLLYLHFYLKKAKKYSK